MYNSRTESHLSYSHPSSPSSISLSLFPVIPVKAEQENFVDVFSSSPTLRELNSGQVRSNFDDLEQNEWNEALKTQTLDLLFSNSDVDEMEMRAGEKIQKYQKKKITTKKKKLIEVAATQRKTIPVVSTFIQPRFSRKRKVRPDSSATTIQKKKVKTVTPTPSSKYHGVSRDNLKWRARFIHKGQRYHIGNFQDEKEAALAYDKAIIKHGL
eukprot:g6330.t1